MPHCNAHLPLLPDHAPPNGQRSNTPPRTARFTPLHGAAPCNRASATRGLWRVFMRARTRTVARI
eukprot:3938344-Rhodomonas_salina.1